MIWDLYLCLAKSLPKPPLPTTPPSSCVQRRRQGFLQKAGTRAERTLSRAGYPRHGMHDSEPERSLYSELGVTLRRERSVSDLLGCRVKAPNPALTLTEHTPPSG